MVKLAVGDRFGWTNTGGGLGRRRLADWVIQHGVDTAKYYQQAERELEYERLAKGANFQDGKV